MNHNYQDEPKPEEVYTGEPSTEAETLNEKLGDAEQVEALDKLYKDLEKKLMASGDLDENDKITLKISLKERVERIKEYYS